MKKDHVGRDGTGLHIYQRNPGSFFQAGPRNERS